MLSADELFSQAIGQDYEDYDLNLISRYLKLLHSFIATQQKELNQIEEEIVDGEDDEYGDPLSAHVPGQVEMMSFPRMLCCNTLAAICTFSEVKLLRVARDDFLRREKPNYLIRSQRHDACEQQLREYADVEKYWKKHGLPYKQSQAWARFTEVKRIRNRTIHADVWLENDAKSERIRQYVADRTASGKTGLSIKHDELVIEPSYCEEACDVVRQLLREVTDGIPKQVTDKF